MKKIVTSYYGPDLDGVASMFAYAEYLRNKGEDAYYYINGKPKEEVKIVCDIFNIELNSLKRWEKPSEAVLVDLNNVSRLDFIKPEEVVDIIDHHVKTDGCKLCINAKVQIELLGAAATLVAERFKNENIKMSRESAILLYYGIISNSINLKAKTTKRKDIEIAQWLKSNFPEISEEKIEVSYGDSQTLYFNPLTGYEIGEIIVDGEAVSEEMLDNISKNGLSLTNIKSSHEIYVEFIKRSYTITYVLDDFALDNIKQEYQYGDKITPPQTPVAQSYMYFVGWFEDENYESLAKFGNMPATDLVVYGQFKLKEYFITLSYEGGGEISPLNQTIIYPQSAVFNIELYDGYSIVDIKVDEISVSEEKLFEINNNGSFIFSILEYGYNSYDNSSFEEHTIYIKLEAKDYEIVFNLNYENGGEIVENFKREEKISFPELPVRQGYSFKGWYTDKACTSEFNLNEMPAKDLEIYAKWEINTYKITLSIFGNGNFYSDQDLSNIKYGENVQLKTNTNLYNYDMEVYVDEQLVETTKGTLLIENVTSDMNIVVRFTKKPFLKSLDGLITIISCLVIAFVIAIVVMTKIIKKRNLYKDMNNY